MQYVRKGIAVIQYLTLSCDYLNDNAPGGFGVCLRPRRCGEPQNAREPKNP